MKRRKLFRLDRACLQSGLVPTTQYPNSVLSALFDRDFHGNGFLMKPVVSNNEDLQLGNGCYPDPFRSLRNYSYQSGLVTFLICLKSWEQFFQSGLISLITIILLPAGYIDFVFQCEIYACKLFDTQMTKVPRLITGYESGSSSCAHIIPQQSMLLSKRPFVPQFEEVYHLLDLLVIYIKKNSAYIQILFIYLFIFIVLSRSLGSMHIIYNRSSSIMCQVISRVRGFLYISIHYLLIIIKNDNKPINMTLVIGDILIKICCVSGLAGNAKCKETSN